MGASDGISPVAARVLGELRSQIKQSGGTGRRPWRVAYALEGISDEEFRDAVQELAAVGAIDVDRATGAVFGFVYLVPAELA